MSRQITFAQLVRTLKNAGFVVSQSKGSHVVFKHVTTETIVVLPAHVPNNEVDVGHLAAVRRTLAESGIVDRDSFDELLVEA